MLDGSKPLSLLQHVGGNPAIAAVNRGKVSVADYDRFVKWVGVGYRSSIKMRCRDAGKSAGRSRRP